MLDKRFLNEEKRTTVVEKSGLVEPSYFKTVLKLNHLPDRKS